MQCSALDYWQKLNLEPLSGAKDLVAIALCDAKDPLKVSIQNWLAGLSDAYTVSDQLLICCITYAPQACGLGKHSPLIHNGAATGLAIVDTSEAGCWSGLEQLGKQTEYLRRGPF